jgi:hypothetical protein
VLPQLEHSMGTILGEVWASGAAPEDALAKTAEDWTQIIQGAGLS